MQPPAVGAPHGKLSVPVDVRIDPNGNVKEFKLARSSGYPRVDRSIRAIHERVRKVEPPPSGELHLRIYFELDVKH